MLLIHVYSSEWCELMWVLRLKTQSANDANWLNLMWIWCEFVSWVVWIEWILMFVLIFVIIFCLFWIYDKHFNKFQCYFFEIDKLMLKNKIQSFKKKSEFFIIVKNLFVEFFYNQFECFLNVQFIRIKISIVNFEIVIFSSSRWFWQFKSFFIINFHNWSMRDHVASNCLLAFDEM